MPEPKKSVAVLLCYFCNKPFAPIRHHACNSECCLVSGLLPDTVIRLHYDFCEGCSSQMLKAVS